MSNQQPSISFFDTVAAIGSKILQTYGGSPVSSETNRYLRLVEETYETLAHIHGNLLDVMINVDLAQTMEEANKILGRVEESSLKDYFRAEYLCDELGTLGLQLRKLPQQEFKLTAEEEKTWKEFYEDFYDRETSTANLYGSRLSDLRQLSVTETNLDTLKTKVNEISNALTIQKAQFDLLAKKARTIRLRK